MLLTKLHIPNPPKDTLSRVHLFTKLDDALNKKLILVSAPAGYGKTILISDWIEQKSLSVAWCSIDSRDNDPSEFLKLIIVAIQKQDREIGKNSLELLNNPDTAKFEFIIELFINDLLQLTSEIVLVLDDLHLIENKPIFDILSMLIEYKPESLKLLISTRSDPPLPFARLRSQNEILELRSSDLSFKKTDILNLFNKKLKLDLSEKSIEILQQKTEGWIAGLQLSALTFKGQADIGAYIQKMAGDNRYIMDYLIEEVLHNQPKELKEFLLKTSVLDQFNASLCNYILQIDNSQQILEQFEKNNMFIVPLDFEKKWFRYHHLFADLLKHYLTYEFKNEINEIHFKASSWFSEKNLIVQSIEHAFKAENKGKAVELLNEHIEDLWIAGQHKTIASFGEQLTQEQITSNPKFSIFYSWMIIQAGKIIEADEILSTTEKVLSEKQIQNDEDKDIIGKHSLTYAYLYAISGKKDKVFKYSEKAIQNLSDKNPLWNGWGYIAFGDAYSINANLAESVKSYKLAFEYGQKAQNMYLKVIAKFKLAICYGRHGKYKTAFNICKKKLDEINSNNNLNSIYEQYLSGFYSLMGGLYLEWNNLDEAKKYTEKGFELSKKTNDISFKVYSYVAMIHFHYSCGDIDKATLVLEELESSSEYSQTTPWLSIHITAWKADLLMYRSELEKASEILSKYENNIDEEIAKKPEYILLRLAKLYILQQKSDKAFKIIDNLLKQADQYEKLFSKFYGYLLKAKAHIVLSQKPDAKNSLIKAILIAQEEDYNRLFIEEGNELLDLFNEIGNDKKIKSSKELNSISNIYFSKLMQAFEKEKQFKKSSLKEVLTNREIETLQLIAQDFTNQKIADKLFVSLNTIKTRLKNIYLKLEVDNRRKAVEKAKREGII